MRGSLRGSFRGGSMRGRKGSMRGSFRVPKQERGQGRGASNLVTMKPKVETKMVSGSCSDRMAPTSFLLSR